MMNHLFNMGLTNNFQTRKNQSEVKMWGILLQIINDLPDNLKLFKEWNGLFVIVKKHTRNMSILYNKNVLIDAALQG